jgi:8-oxo-dGTP pyrophosphatase MutT (NUDIX family)
MRNISTFSQFINEGLEMKVSAGLAIIWEDKVLLAHTTGRNFKTGYGIPKGGIEKGETQLDAAIRETSEEIGINVPRSLVSSNSYQFGVDAKKWGYKKIVHYYIVQIDSLDQIGLKEPKVPKSQLQLEEINDARFMDYKQAAKVINVSQKDLLSNLHRLGLVK